MDDAAQGFSDTDDDDELRLVLLGELYGPDVESVAQRLKDRLAAFSWSPENGRTTTPSSQQSQEQQFQEQQSQELWSHDDVWLIAYPDHFQRPEEAPLATLLSVLETSLSDLFSGVHVLPFYPWSSDDGFSVIDYGRVDNRYGTWSDIHRLGSRHRLMVDAVMNHVSTESHWFRGFLAGASPFDGYFHTEPEGTDVSAVVRPRTHPLLTEFETAAGPTWVWTTFSSDQADLDYRNPDVLFEMVDVLFTYLDHGATVIRLDAVGFLWKDAQRSSLNLPETHALVQLLRSCIDQVAPGTVLISETNVPHEENVSYLRPNPPEVHAVYQFALAPLLADAVLNNDVATFATWADGIADMVGPGRTFFNFLACHDGIGVRAVEGLLPPSRIDRLVSACERGGGQVSQRTMLDGSTNPYELNTTWFDLLADGVDEQTAIARHLATHAVMLALPGMPALYAHSLFGSSNDHHGAELTSSPRALNRQRFTDLDRLQALLDDADSRPATVLRGLRKLLRARRGSRAFHPDGACAVSEVEPGVLRIERVFEEHYASWTISLSAVLRSVDGRVIEPYEVWS